ncbi:ROK family protein [Gracilibacillus caseinilyticus]|uniref:ROK family protein n=1 Tax=Gracilibacillus caseinilyticus TaxID=2932256 RepID=A0ABY4EVC8_9BACI|nr:ROK family protein [Gracilibacillus caseinilyticus]UOQ48352.1 ROK family protein [Gracilibacillus caseinilyticus]
MRNELYLCFDIGGTNVKYGVLDREGTFLFQDKYPTNRQDMAAFVDDFSNTVHTLSQSYQLTKIGISFPGFINPTTGFAQYAGAFEQLHGTNIVELLSKNVNIPIVIENDANCATLAEKIAGNAVNSDHFICITIGTGIGGGIFVNGGLVNGYGFKAGEFGLMIVNGMENGYHNMHEIASTSSFIQQYKQIKQLSDDVHVEGDEVFQSAKQDPKVNAMLQKWFQYVSFGIFNLAATLNPEKILIGGAISERPDLYERLEKTLMTIPSWTDIEAALVPCKHHNEAGMLGALYKCLKS